MNTNLAVESCNEIFNIPIKSIKLNPYHPRRFFEKISVRELSESIKNYGILQPISVKIMNGRYYEVVSGRRRLMACRLLGYEDIPAIVVDMRERESSAMALIDNIQRDELNFIEEAEGMKCLINDYGYSLSEFAGLIGKSEEYIEDRLRLLKLPRKIIRKLLDNHLGFNYAVEFLKINDECIMEAILDKIVEDGMSLKGAKMLIENSIMKNELSIPIINENIKIFFSDIAIFNNTLKGLVDIMDKSGMKTEYSMTESDEFYEIIIKVKK